VIIKTQNRRPNNIQKTAPQSYRTEIKILPFPLLFGSEQRGPGATLLGWPKSIYYWFRDILHVVRQLLHFALTFLLHFASMLLHFALVLHFAAIPVAFCVDIAFCGDYYILRRNIPNR